MRERDDDAKVRAMMRSKNIDVRSNCGYNVTNGQERMSVDVPLHRVYNPDQLQSVGATILGNGVAGKPMRKEWYQTPINKPQVQSQPNLQHYQENPPQYQEQYQEVQPHQ